MEIIKQICEMCRYKSLSNATFPCVDCCSRDRWELAETIVVNSKGVETQQREINQHKTQVAAMREALEEATETIENMYGHDIPQTVKYRDILNSANTCDYHNPSDIDEILGGVGNESNT